MIRVGMMAAAVCLADLGGARALVPGGSAAPAGEEITITAQDCRLLVRHVPAADVAYRPGVDVHGRAVVPADLDGGGGLGLGGEDLLLQLRLELPVPATAGLVQAVGGLGVVSIRNGRAYLDDQPMNEYAQEILVEACRAQGVR